ncbi:GerMN domain-containing protein [Thermoactinomyces mirandus]|uniref:GerMN domain-containing protein n=1 Tax=Thermoactinomyces mirandus TaxID=2756294 RepID=A0A7W2ASG5_9BACL|nr:GerMN domain-containing protein [Thermoactinomyces mirandus]MBA4602645.1 GerMN domain-containing protein [Thermoactinomyces mirandus]
MHNRWFWASACFLLVPLVLSGCVFGPEKNASKPIDPPPADIEQNTSEVTANQAKKEEAEQTLGVELYFMTHTGHLAPYTLNLPSSKGIAKEVLKFMVKDGPGQAMLPKGFTPILPKGTQVKALNIQDGVATIDFSKEFLNYKQEEEENLLSAITWTLTGFPTVNEVNIWVDGKLLSAMPKGKTPAQGLTRKDGINLEVAKGTDITRSMPVTLYFIGQLPDNHTYYVPVTRMVNASDNVGEVVIDELVKGPQLQSGLSAALDTTLKVNKVQVKGDLAVADFGEQLLQYGKNAASEDALQTIVLSLTENTSAEKVKLIVNGKQNITVEGEKTVSEPVSRPKFINPNKS